MNIFCKVTSPLFNNLQRLLQPILGGAARNCSLLTLNASQTGVPRLLAPPITPVIVPNCGFKQVGKLKKRCKGCFMVVRQERTYMLCRLKPRHKQMQMKKSEEKSWILSHATQGPFRAW